MRKPIVLFGFTGGVASVLACKVGIELQETGYDVIYVSTERGLYFATVVEKECGDCTQYILVDKAGNEIGVVMTDRIEWPAGHYSKGDPVPHIDYSEQADLLLIAPITADTIADIAIGKADRFLTSLTLAWDTEKPMVIAPAMNTRMWSKPVVQRNLNTIALDYAAEIVGPVEGKLACGVEGMGAMARIEDILARVKFLLPTENN